MKELIEKLSEILEVENLDVTKQFTEFDEWDSLCILSILSMLDSDYHIQMKGVEIVSFSSIEAFCDFVLANRK